MTGGANVELWALPAAGPDVCLGDLGDYTVSRVAGEIGTLTFRYPPNGEGFELLAPLAVRAGRLEVEVRYDGTSTTADRAIVLAGKGDRIQLGTVFEFSGLFLGVLFRDAVLGYLEGAENGETQLSGTPGLIVRTLMLRAQERDVLADITWSSFSNTHDSNGDPWERPAAVKFSPGRDYASILAELESELELCEWELTADRELRLYNPGNRGTDRTVPGAQVVLEQGRDLADGPTAATAEGIGTTVVGVGADGLYSEATNPTALAFYGRRIEVYRDYGSVADQGTLDALVQAEAAILSDGTGEQAHKLVLGPDCPVPGRDFGTSDWVLRGLNGGTTAERVSQWVISRSSGEVTAAVTLGTLIASREQRTRKLIDRLANGSGIVGTSTRSPEVDDGKAPAAPGTVTVASLAYYDGGTPLASLAAGWAAVTTNADGTALDDLSGYEVWFRYESGQGLPDTWQIGGVTSATSLTWSPLVSGATVQVRARAVDKFGNVSAWSPVTVLDTATDADAPPVLSAPNARNYLGIMVLGWDGLGALGEAMPGDFDLAEIHISTAGPGFTPDRPGGGVDGSTTFVDVLRGPGEYPTTLGSAAADVQYWAKLVGVDKSGNASAASAAGTATPGLVEDGDVRELSIGKLTAGILTAIMTISGLIRTAAAGARVELDTTGLRCIAADGRILLEFNIPTSILSLVGRLIAGQGVGVGATLVIDPGPPPRLRMYPNGTAQYWELRATSTDRPDGSTGASMEITSRNTSGQTDGFSIHAWATNAWLGHRLTSGAWSGGRVILQRIGGLAGLYSDTGQVVVDNDTGVFISTDEQIQVLADQGVIVSAGDDLYLAADGRIYTSKPMGTEFGFSQTVQGGAAAGVRLFWEGTHMSFIDNQNGNRIPLGQGLGAYKTFVLPHPTDPDRWLVHAAVEGPEAAVYHRGVAELVDGLAVVELPPYFEASTLVEGRTVHLTMLLPDEPVEEFGPPPLAPVGDQPAQPAPKPLPIPERYRVRAVAASLPRDGRFRIVGDAPDGTRVAWLVHAVRADGPPLLAEPLRADVEIDGQGPYRYIAGHRAV